ncbi:MAG: type II toxin-antitoxin system RelE/ParE family toxin [Methylococcaceae bacterium]|nr:MAG: type II toxin-antitoxin system RelE/ParE family toxin [Methylococcaceae bacterium]
MPPRLEWRTPARKDLLDIMAFIADDAPDAAQALKDEIETKVATLPAHSRLYKTSRRVSGLREFVVQRHYVVLYRETPELVEIVVIVHARRQWPPK